VAIPSIGLMSPTKRSRSAMVNSPGFFDGRLGCQRLPLSDKYDSGSPWTSPTNTSDTIVAPTGPRRSPLARCAASLRMYSRDDALLRDAFDEIVKDHPLLFRKRAQKRTLQNKAAKYRGTIGNTSSAAVG